MQHKITIDFAWLEEENERLFANIYLSNMLDEAEELLKFSYDLLNNNKSEVCLSINFDIRDLVKSEINSRRYCGANNKIVMDMKNKSIFSLLKSQLNEMIEMIDSIEYENGD